MFEGIWRTSVKICCALVITGSFAMLGTVGCEAGGVGDPCIPEDEFKENPSVWRSPRCGATRAVLNRAAVVLSRFPSYNEVLRNLQSAL